MLMLSLEGRLLASILASGSKRDSRRLKARCESESACEEVLRDGSTAGAVRLGTKKTKTQKKTDAQHAHTRTHMNGNTSIGHS